MKTLKIILIITIAVLMLNSCARDEDLIRYYKQPTGEGYVFVKNEDGTITPFANKKDIIQLVASRVEGSGWFSTSWEHTDVYNTDENGKITYKFVKTIDRHKVEYYAIGFNYEGATNEHIRIANTYLYYLKPNEICDKKVVIIDTIFVTLK